MSFGKKADNDNKNQETAEERKLTPEEKAQKRLREFLETVLELVIVAALVFLFLRFVAFRSVVYGDSMNATLKDHDNLVVERVSYYFHEPERFDIVVFVPPNIVDGKDHYIKRVIGLPGETVEIIDGRVHITGELLTDDTYGLDIMYKNRNKEYGTLHYGPVTVPEGEIFVLGDNRNNSHDSRASDVETISIKTLSGRVLFRFWPLNAMKKF